MKRITQTVMVLTLSAGLLEPAARGASVPARVLDPFEQPVPKASIAIYRTISDPRAEYGFRFDTVSAGTADKNGDLALDFPDDWTNLSVKAECTNYVPWAQGLESRHAAAIRLQDGRPTCVTFRMERHYTQDDLLALEKTVDAELPAKLKQLLSTSFLPKLPGV